MPKFSDSDGRQKQSASASACAFCPSHRPSETSSSLSSRSRRGAATRSPVTSRHDSRGLRSRPTLRGDDQGRTPGEAIASWRRFGRGTGSAGPLPERPSRRATRRDAAEAAPCRDRCRWIECGCWKRAIPSSMSSPASMREVAMIARASPRIALPVVASKARLRRWLRTLRRWVPTGSIT